MGPKVSVLLPFYNADPWLEAAAQSVLDDGLDAMQLLPLDDGSTDSGPAIAARLARADPRVRSVSGPNRGIVAALNWGLSLSRAPFVARMDGDDLSLPGRLTAQLDFLEANPSVAVVNGQVEVFRDDGPLMGRVPARSRSSGRSGPNWPMDGRGRLSRGPSLRPPWVLVCRMKSWKYPQPLADGAKTV